MSDMQAGETTNDRRLTQTELAIMQGVVLAALGDVGSGAASPRMVRQVAALFPDSAFPFDMSKYISSSPPVTLNTEHGRAVWGLERLTQRLLFVNNGQPIVEELRQPIQ